MQQVRPGTAQSEVHSGVSQYPLLPHPCAVSLPQYPHPQNRATYPDAELDNTVSHQLHPFYNWPHPCPGLHDMNLAPVSCSMYFQFPLFGQTPYHHITITCFQTQGTLSASFNDSYHLGFLSWRYLSWICKCLYFSCFSPLSLFQSIVAEGVFEG